MNKTILFVISLAFSLPALAQQYKWFDKDGRVQYGDVPPAGVKATPLRAPAAGSAPAPGAKPDGKPQPTPEAAYQKRQQETKEQEEKAAKERADAEARRANCENAQSSLRMLQSGQRVARTDAAGERVFMDDSQRAREIERVQRAVSDSCK